MEMEKNWSPETEETEIDLLELWNVLRQKAWALIIGAVAGALIAGILTVTLITPLYESTSMIYVYSKTTSITSITDLQLGSQLAVDFQIVGTTREVIENVIDRLELDMTYEELLNTVEITNPQSSHILKITVTNPDPEMAATISNTLADELRARIADVMNTDEPSIVDHAYIPTSPSSPSLVKNAGLGGMAVAVVLAGIFIATYLLDDTIKTGDDVRKYLDQNVLAEIPIDRTQKKKKAS